jgi:hypothetical protein
VCQVRGAQHALDMLLSEWSARVTRSDSSNALCERSSLMRVHLERGDVAKNSNVLASSHSDYSHDGLSYVEAVVVEIGTEWKN